MAPIKPSTTHARPIHFMYGFSALPPVVGRYVSIFFGVCSICGMRGFSITFGCSATCGCSASDYSGFCGCSGFSRCGVTSRGGVGFF